MYSAFYLLLLFHIVTFGFHKPVNLLPNFEKGGLARMSIFRGGLQKGVAIFTQEIN